MQYFRHNNNFRSTVRLKGESLKEKHTCCTDDVKWSQKIHQTKNMWQSPFLYRFELLLEHIYVLGKVVDSFGEVSKSIKQTYDRFYTRPNDA